MRKICIYFSVIIFCCSCQDQYDICDQPRTVNFNAALYHSVAGAETIAYADSLTISLLDASTNIYNQAPQASKFNFPLIPVVDSSRYFIRLNNNWPGDTLTILYATQTFNISPECGNVNIHNLLNVYSTTNSIDSVKLINAAVNTSTAENIKIYF